MISEALLECPIIENAMVQQMVSPGGSPSMVCPIFGEIGVIAIVGYRDCNSGRFERQFQHLQAR